MHSLEVPAALQKADQAAAHFERYQRREHVAMRVCQRLVCATYPKEPAVTPRTCALPGSLGLADTVDITGTGNRPSRSETTRSGLRPKATARSLHRSAKLRTLLHQQHLAPCGPRVRMTSRARNCRTRGSLRHAGAGAASPAAQSPQPAVPAHEHPHFCSLVAWRLRCRSIEPRGPPSAIRPLVPSTLASRS